MKVQQTTPDQQNLNKGVGLCVQDMSAYSTADSAALNILEMGLVEGKWCRDRLNKAVWEFRDAHRFERGHGIIYNPEYRAAVETYCARTAECFDRSAIEELSTPERYLSIRQAGRMRAYQDVLDEEVIAALCREIKATFTWLSLEKNGKF